MLPLRRLHHDKRVESLVVISLKSFEDKVTVLIVEPASAGVINRRFKINSLSSLLPKPNLDLCKQPAPDLFALSMWNDIYRDDMTELSRFRAANYKANYFVVIGGDKRRALSRSHIELKLKTGIGQVLTERRSVYVIKVGEI